MHLCREGVLFADEDALVGVRLAGIRELVGAVGKG